MTITPVAKYKNEQNENVEKMKIDNCCSKVNKSRYARE